MNHQTLSHISAVLSSRRDGVLLAILLCVVLVAPAHALDPNSFTSLGANPFTVTGAYTINSAGGTPVLTRPGLSSINGVVSGGIAVFTFNEVSIPAGATISATRASGARPIALLSKGTTSLASGATIHVSGANGVNNDGSGNPENGGAAGPGGGGGGGGGGDDFSGLYGNGGVGSPNGGNAEYVGGFIIFRPGAGGGTGGGGASSAGGGGGAFGGNGGVGNDLYVLGSGGVAYGNLGVFTGGTSFGTTLQGGGGGGGGQFGNGGGGGGGGGALELGAVNGVTLAGNIHANGGSGGIYCGGGGAGGGVYVHGSSVSLTGGINASGGNGGGSGGGGGGGRVFIFTSSGLLSGGSMGNVYVFGGSGANSGGTGTATLGGPAISVTVKTSPAGATFSVDGVNYTTQQVFSWVAGSTHSIGFASPQSGGTGLNRIFAAWSDAGAVVHNVMPTAGTTYTASYVLAATEPSTITSATRLGNGSFQLNSTNVSGASFTVRATEDLTLPKASWTNLGPPTETPPGSGVYFFTDPQAGSFPRRFYVIASP